jgi:release factor glutamine methyltransferase
LAEVPTDPKPDRKRDGGVDERADQKKDRWTLLEVLRWTTRRFEERGLFTPRLDAEILIAAALGLPRVQLYVQFDRPLDAVELTAIREHVRRRQAGESVAYIVGHKEFFGLDFAVDRRVLVPRPDTETLVDEALARLRERSLLASNGPPDDGVAASTDSPVQVSPDDRPGAFPEVSPRTSIDVSLAPLANPSPRPEPAFRIADVGTGSGAIAVTLASRVPAATVFAVDISTDALEVARANATRHNVAVTFLNGDLAESLRPHAPFDLMVANLPYVATADLAGLPPEVASEPVLALDGGPDGLALVRRLIVAAGPLLTSGGALVLEIGQGQAEQTAMFYRSAGFVDVRVRRDLGSVDRVVSAVKP